MESFRFKVKEDLLFDFYEYRDIVYEAKRSIANPDCYVISWVDEETNTVQELKFHEKFVLGAINDGDWIVL